MQNHLWKIIFIYCYYKWFFNIKKIDPLKIINYEAKFKLIGADVWSNEAGFAEQADRTGITGICGSGIVEAIAELYLPGLLSVDGVITPPKGGAGDHLVAAGRTYSYMLYRGQIEISISQKDVRAIQLAKAALYAGARLLMDKLGVDNSADARQDL